MHLKNRILALVFTMVSASALLIGQAQAGPFGGGHRNGNDVVMPPSVAHSSVVGDADLRSAVSDRRYRQFVEAGQVTVTELLPDDTQGLPHQRWMVRLSDGSQVYCVYNLDLGGKIPLEVGSQINIGGEFKQISQGALLHWLHHDPQGNHPDGYVEFNGVRYGSR